ncbi:MAG: hypothetical protein HUK15_07125, partial [Bacteroidales bacterium]|nr:hypothetical protein [Bacteroidales bacterium]
MTKFHLLNIVFIFAIALTSKAQNECPEEWSQYTSEMYFSHVIPSVNEDFKPEADFFGAMEKKARKQVAKTISTILHNLLVNNNLSIDEDEVLNFFETTCNNSETTLQLFEKKSVYNNYNRQGCLLVYVEKEKVCKFYNEDVNNNFKKEAEILETVKTLIDAGKKEEARMRIEEILPLQRKNRNEILLLKIFNHPIEKLYEFRDTYNNLHQELKDAFRTIGPKVQVYIEYDADVFGQPYWTMQENIKDWLASHGYGCTSDKTTAKYSVSISSKSRKYNTMGNGTTTTYYSFVDSNISIFNNSQNTSLYNDKMSIKGSFTKNYDEAAYKAYT